jgi:hypothetical protein
LREFDYLPELAVFDLLCSLRLIILHEGQRSSESEGGGVLRDLDGCRNIFESSSGLGLLRLGRGVVCDVGLAVLLVVLLVVGVILKRQVERREILLLRLGAPAYAGEGTGS